MAASWPKAQYRTSNLHTYAASFGGDLAHSLIAEHTSPGDTVLDPFAGAATTLLQARLLGRVAVGIDVDPVACLIARVVTTPYSVNDLEALRRRVMEQLATLEAELGAAAIAGQAWLPGTSFPVNGFTATVPHFDQIEFWFAPLQRVLLASLVALAGASHEPRHKDLIDLAISASIIRKWPNTLSQARDLDHSRPHRVLRNQLSVDSQLAVFSRAFKRIIECLLNINGPENHCTATAQVIEGDTAEALRCLPPDSVDYTLTSPPYFNAIDYPRAHRFSQWWLWPERAPLTRSSYLGLKPGGSNPSAIELCAALLPRRMESLAWLVKTSWPTYAALCRYIADMNSVIGGLAQVVKRGGPVTLVLANNAVRGNVVPVADIVADLLAGNGFEAVQVEPRQIKSSRRRYPYGIRGFRGLMASEYLIHARNRRHHRPD